MAQSLLPITGTNLNCPAGQTGCACLKTYTAETATWSLCSRWEYAVWLLENQGILDRVSPGLRLRDGRLIVENRPWTRRTCQDVMTAMAKQDWTCSWIFNGVSYRVRFQYGDYPAAGIEVVLTVSAQTFDASQWTGI